MDDGTNSATQQLTSPLIFFLKKTLILGHVSECTGQSLLKYSVLCSFRYVSVRQFAVNGLGHKGRDRFPLPLEIVSILVAEIVVWLSAWPRQQVEVLPHLTSYQQTLVASTRNRFAVRTRVGVAHVAVQPYV